MESITPTTNRITVVDALRGFALVSIMLLHNIERFEVSGLQIALPAWMVSLDSILWDSFFFVFGGKSYAIFALLFGLTFFIQSHNQQKQGKEFRGRFIWRLILLLVFGFINTLFYQGEILVLYALVGLVLVPFAKLSNKTIFIAAIFFLLQPLIWIEVLMAVNNPTPGPDTPFYMEFYPKVGSFLRGDSMVELMKSNITNGRIASLLWYWENGRVDQTIGLFLLGFLSGRKAIFLNTPENKSFWKKTLISAALVFYPLLYLKSNSTLFSEWGNVNQAIGTLFNLWSNLALMLVLVAGFVLLFYTSAFQPSLNKLSPIGKMSLSNYILQSIVGATLYYGFGLGLYRYVGPTYSLCIGIVLAIGMGIFSNYWMNTHRRGPLEGLWHKLTWLGTRK